MKTIQMTSALVLFAGAVTVAACGAETPETETIGSDSEAVRGAVYTTFDETREGCLHGNGNGINCNHYEYKCDVYVSGGPAASGLSDGDYYFAILKPGAQNGGFIDDAPGNLSSPHDRDDDRRFSVEDHQITNEGTHDEGTINGKLIIQACDYDDTPNNGGVYILAVCEWGATSPKQCKFDAFKVRDHEPVCGDGHVDEGEDCDDGNTDDTDECTNECEVPVYPCCGDGHVDPGEGCETDDDCDSGYTCDDSCVCQPPPAECGNCIVEGDEECDDGNTDNTDGCTNACELPECGDGYVQDGEECDDGNADDLYCDSYCQICTPPNGTHD